MSTEDMSELVTRGVLKEELEQLEQRLTERIDELKADAAHTAKFMLERMEELLTLREEPSRDLPARVTALENETLPPRVARLEAKVFPPKRTTRRRG